MNLNDCFSFISGIELEGASEICNEGSIFGGLRDSLLSSNYCCILVVNAYFYWFLLI